MGFFFLEPYNFEALGSDQHAGALHPLGKVRAEFRLANAEHPPKGVLANWVQTNFLRDGLRRDAYKLVRRVGFLGMLLNAPLHDLLYLLT